MPLFAVAENRSPRLSGPSMATAVFYCRSGAALANSHNHHIAAIRKRYGKVGSCSFPYLQIPPRSGMAEAHLKVRPRGLPQPLTCARMRSRARRRRCSDIWRQPKWRRSAPTPHRNKGCGRRGSDGQRTRETIARDFWRDSGCLLSQAAAYLP